MYKKIELTTQLSQAVVALLKAEATYNAIVKEEPAFRQRHPFDFEADYSKARLNDLISDIRKETDPDR